MILLDVAGYSLFNNADVFLATAGKVLLTGAGVVVGGLVLSIALVIVIAIIAAVAVRRGLRYQSVPHTVGTFFRLAGMAIAVFLSALIIPIVAFWFSVPALYLFLAFVITVSIGYLIGRGISKLIGQRMGRYATYLRTIDIVGNRILRLVNGL